MCVYRVGVRVDLINELLHKSGGGGDGLFKEGYLNLLKNWNKKILFFLKHTELQLTKLFFSVHSSEFSHKIYDVFRFSYFK